MKPRVGLLLSASVLVLCCLMAANGQDYEDDVQYQTMKALRRFYHAEDMGWFGSGSDPCEWAGVACDIVGHIVQIKLDGLGLTGGTLPPQWSIFDRLQVVDLHGIGIDGELPEEWSKLTSLEYVYLDNNKIEGTIPNAWCYMTSIRHLYVNGNELTGELPRCTTWQDMEVMYLENCKFSGSLPKEWSSMKHLTSINASNNSLGGELPKEWSEMESAEEIELENNEFEGPLPVPWSFLSFLQALYLNGNKLTGELPSEFGYLINMDILSLDGNRFSGNLPSAWWQMAKLQYIYLYDNQLTGTLPNAWGALTSLAEIHLDGNKLTGTVPARWEALQNATHIYLRRNHLSGPIPEEWGALVSLQELHLWDNKLSDILPPSLGQLDSLKVMAIHKNEITGNLPTQWANMTNLQYLYLQENLLTGELPGEWGSMASLEQLMLNSNLLEDQSLPVGWQNLEELKVLSLADNAISIKFPKEWKGLVSRLTWIGIKNTMEACVDGGVFDGLSSEDSDMFLKLIGRKTAAISSQWSSNIAVCVVPAPPAPKSPPPPPPTPPVPASSDLLLAPQFPTASPSPDKKQWIPSPSPPPPPFTALESWGASGDNALARGGVAADNDVNNVTSQSYQVNDLPAAAVDDVVTKALIIAAALVLAFVLVAVILTAIWYHRKMGRKSGTGSGRGAQGNIAGQRPPDVIMEHSVLGMMPASENPTPRVTTSFERQASAGRMGTGKLAFFRHGLPTPRDGGATPSMSHGSTPRISHSGVVLMPGIDQQSPSSPAYIQARARSLSGSSTEHTRQPSHASAAAAGEHIDDDLAGPDDHIEPSLHQQAEDEQAWREAHAAHFLSPQQTLPAVLTLSPAKLDLNDQSIEHAVDNDDSDSSET